MANFSCAGSQKFHTSFPLDENRKSGQEIVPSPRTVYVFGNTFPFLDADRIDGHSFASAISVGLFGIGERRRLQRMGARKAKDSKLCRRGSDPFNLVYTVGYVKLLKLRTYILYIPLL